MTFEPTILVRMPNEKLQILMVCRDAAVVEELLDNHITISEEDIVMDEEDMPMSVLEITDKNLQSIEGY